MKIGVVVTVFHSFERVIAFVRQIPLLGNDIVTVIVDNDSTPESSRRLAEAIGAVYIENNEEYSQKHEKLFLISSVENLGYARGNNLGASFLRRNYKVDYLLFSNDDVLIETKNITEILVDSLNKHPEVKAIGPCVLGHSGNAQSPHRRKISIYRQLGWQLLPFLRRKRSETVTVRQSCNPPPASGMCYWVSGAFFLVEAKAFFECSGFDERTFLYYEEVILAERLLQKGWRMYFENSCTVRHLEGASTGKNEKMEAIRKDSACVYYRYYCKNNPVLLWLFRCLA